MVFNPGAGVDSSGVLGTHPTSGDALRQFPLSKSCQVTLCEVLQLLALHAVDFLMSTGSYDQLDSHALLKFMKKLNR
jgi:hypothetical protein